MMNNWTREDLPAARDVRDIYYAVDDGQEWGAILDAVVGHLNRRFPKVPPVLVMPETERPESDAARWRRAHEIVEGERDLARDRCREAGRERDAAVRVKGEAFDRAVRAERDRDVWKARAEAAESLTDPNVTRDEVWRVVAAHDPGDDELAVCRVNRLTDAVCALFGVEAEPAGPVEEQADALADILYGDELVTDHMRDVLERVVRAGMLFPGQEDRHVDQ